MLVAIALDGTGYKKVEDFREAASTSAAVTAFCNEYTPPKNPGDYIGHDTGWGSWQDPGIDKCWYYDHGTTSLVACAMENDFSANLTLKEIWAFH
jgi:hypothetical protein